MIAETAEMLSQRLAPHRFHDMYLDCLPANVSRRAPEALGPLERRQRSAGDKGSDAITLGDRKQQMGGEFSIVLHGHVRSGPSREVTDGNRFERGLGQIIIRALDAHCQTLSGP